MPAASASLLLKRARALSERGESEAALRLYVKVLEMEPDNAAVMAAAAELLAELGDGAAARELLLKAIALDPTHGADKYVLLGHLEQGGRAILAFERALELMAAQAAGLGRVDGDVRLAAQKKALGRRTASVMASLAKVYLTDCFLEKDALKQCERLLDGALLQDPGCAEATQALADLRLSQGRRGEALLLVLRTVELSAASTASRGSSKGGGGPPSGRDGTSPSSSSAAASSSYSSSPSDSYDFRTVTSRLLVELGQYEPAASLLEALAAEDGEDTEVWYLLGLCCMLLGRPGRSRQALGAARELLLRAQAGTDTALLEQIEALLERPALSEEDKSTFWNPRWWVRSDGKAEGSPAPSVANGGSIYDGGGAGSAAAAAAAGSLGVPSDGAFLGSAAGGAGSGSLAYASAAASAAAGDDTGSVAASSAAYGGGGDLLALQMGGQARPGAAGAKTALPV